METIIQVAKAAGGSVKGPYVLRTSKLVWPLLKSPFVHKNAQEHWALLVFKREVIIKNITQGVIDKLYGLEIPAGVGVTIKI